MKVESLTHQRGTPGFGAGRVFERVEQRNQPRLEEATVSVVVSWSEQERFPGTPKPMADERSDEEPARGWSETAPMRFSSSAQTAAGSARDRRPSSPSQLVSSNSRRPQSLSVGRSVIVC